MLHIVTATFVLCVVKSQIPHMGNINDLRNAITRGPNRRVGVELQYSIIVKNVLPSTVQLVNCNGRLDHGIVCHNTTHLKQLVQDGTLLAGLIVEYTKNESNVFHLFTSTVVSPITFFMRPDASADTPHGVPAEKSSRDFALALNGAIVRAQNKGLFSKLLSTYPWANIVELTSCKTKDYKLFPVPNKREATGILREVFDNNTFKVATFKLQTGIHFTKMVIDEFLKLSGPDSEIYGEGILVENLTPTREKSASAFTRLMNGSAYIADKLYNEDFLGTFMTCSNDSDCSLIAGEVCTVVTASYYGEPIKDPVLGGPLYRCQHPVRARMDMFQASCIVIGWDWKFFTSMQSHAIVDKKQRPTYAMMWLPLPLY